LDQPNAGADPLHAGDVVAGYRIVERIGQGGMGDVFRAWDDRLRRHVAIKAPRLAASFDEVARRRFLRETRVACQVNHPFVATVYDVIEERSQPFLVMEFIDGTRLDEILRSDHPPTDVITRYATEIAEALVAIHAEGIIHRDLKPANVMVTRAGHVKVMDFGVALPASDSLGGDVEATLTHEGHAVGTINYMSPEQVAGRRPDPRSDLFALGIMLYEAITGEHPFRRESPLAIASAIVSDAPGGGTEPQTLTKSGPMRHVVMKLLAKDPDARYDSAEAVVADLRAVAAGEELPSLRGTRLRARPRWIVPSLVAIVVVAAVAVVLWLRPKPPLPKAGVDSPPRPVVAVLPFEDRVGDLDGTLRAQMITDLLAADLGDSPTARTLSSRRVEDLLDGAPSPRVRADEVARVRRGAKVGAVIAGTLYRGDNGFRASLDYYASGSDEPVPVQIAAVSPAALVDVAAARIRSFLDPGHRGRAGPGVAALTSENDDARLLELRARRALRESRYNEAIAFLEDAIRIDPEFVAAHTLLADAADRAGYGRKSKEAAERAVRLCDARGDRIAARLSLAARATYARVNDRLDDELEARRELAERYPDDPELLLAYSSSLRRKSAAEAWPVLERAVNLDPQDPRSYILRGRLQTALKHSDDAEASWRRADELFSSVGSPTGPADVAMARGNAAFGRSDYRNAAERYAAAAEIFGRSKLPVLRANARKSEADARLLLGDTGAAEPLYVEAAAVARQAGFLRVTLSALESLAGAWYVAGRFADAERQMRACVDDARQLDNRGLLLVPLANLASLLETTRHPAEALAAGEEASSIAQEARDKESGTLAEMVIADAMFQTGKIGDAKRRYESLVQPGPSTTAGPDPSAPQLGLARIDLYTGHLSDAIDHAEKSLAGFRKTKRGTQIEAALLLRARVFAELGSRTEAESDLTAAAASLGAGEHRVARLALARCFAARAHGDVQAARRWLGTIRLTTEAQAASGLAPEIASEWCAVNALAGDAHAAVDSCRRVLDDRQSMTIERASARARLAIALKRLGRPEASDTARRAVSEAQSLDAPSVSLLAQSSLFATSADPAERDGASRAAREALGAYLDAAPAQRREAIQKRPDVAAIERSLGGPRANSP
jgi:tetratricopeptide (TPR) repeat protein